MRSGSFVRILFGALPAPSGPRRGRNLGRRGPTSVFLLCCVAAATGVLTPDASSDARARAPFFCCFAAACSLVAAESRLIQKNQSFNQLEIYTPVAGDFSSAPSFLIFLLRPEEGVRTRPKNGYFPSELVEA